MPVTTVGTHQVHVDPEGFLTEFYEWDDRLAAELAAVLGIELGETHWQVLRFLRADFQQRGETATLRQVAAGTGIAIKQLFALFPTKPAKKMAYVAGLPKPHGCV
ncbi:TusE/DsrC/DsvC family sulfur relay protein [Solwaraspora sp. WMMB335]|uniref:TusE/DsrC/DsvC family sulfur relay protein n=1 Tax=Solwaraspora sp. WMMB335 TaxID=3404118 RepID=UPI003B962DC3